MRGVRLSLSLASQLNGKREKKEKNDCTADRSSAFAATELWYVVFDTVVVSVSCFPEFLTLLSVLFFFGCILFRVLDAVVVVVVFFFCCMLLRFRVVFVCCMRLAIIIVVVVVFVVVVSVVLRVSVIFHRL